ncbi:MAG: hypothetical protein ABIR15_17715 [Chitinophagaceae bacterium]
MKYIFLIFFVIPATAFCQVIDPMDPLKNEDPFKMEIHNSITRVLMTLSSDLGLSVTPSSEHVIKKSFTFIIKGGPAFSSETLYADANGTYLEKFTIRAIASGELRYYYNLRRRTRLERTVRNFSAGYLSVEPMVASPTIYIVNREGLKNEPGYFAAYINIGFQKQVKKRYYGAFFGTRFPGNIYNNSVDVTDILHAGITVGGIF